MISIIILWVVSCSCILYFTKKKCIQCVFLFILLFKVVFDQTFCFAVLVNVSVLKHFSKICT